MNGDKEQRCAIASSPSREPRFPTGVLGPGSDLDPFGSVWVRSVSGVALRADRDVVDAKEIGKLRVFLSFSPRDLYFSPYSSSVCGLEDQPIGFLSYIYQSILLYAFRARQLIHYLHCHGRRLICSLSIIAL